MADGTTIIAGIPIPFTSAILLSVVALHVLAGLGCVIAGLVAMLSTKGRGRHSGFGATYFWSLAVVFASMTVLAVSRWTEDYELFILGALSFAAAYVGRTAVRHHWLRLHVMGMGASYILLLTAFYVDNGKNLPLWRELPQIAFWLLPSAFGIPITAYVLARHPLFRGIKSCE